MPTANFVSDQVVNCYEDVCDVLRNGEWSHLVATMVTRYQHSSAVYQDKVLLIGGYTNTTEWISLDLRVSLGVLGGRPNQSLYVIPFKKYSAYWVFQLA